MPQESLQTTFIGAVHPLDDDVLILSSALELSLLEDQRFKGAVWLQAMPEKVIEFFLAVSSRDLADLSSKEIPINCATGKTEFPEEHMDILPEYVRFFVNDISQNFNQVGPWPAIFGIQPHMGLTPGAIGFHSDTRQTAPQRQCRALISISEKEPQHETEWISANGLTAADIKSIFSGCSTPVIELPDKFRHHVQILHSGDMIICRSLGEGYDDLLHDALLHRAPAFKNSFSLSNIKRVGVFWERKIELCEPD